MMKTQPLLLVVVLLVLVPVLYAVPITDGVDNPINHVNTTGYCQPDFGAGYPWATPDGTIWYSFNPDRIGSWREMEEYCRGIEVGRTKMALITNSKEQHFTEQLIKNKGSAWIGAARFAGDLIYWYTHLHRKQSLHPMPYTNWYNGQPDNSDNNEDCIWMYDDDGYWCDGYCYHSRRVICELRCDPIQ